MLHHHRIVIGIEFCAHSKICARQALLLPDLLSLTSVPGMRAGHKLASEGQDTRAVQHYLGLGCVKGTHVPPINYRGRS